MEHFKLIITIVDRGKGGKAVDLFRNFHLHFDFACLGAGTASSRILNYFGLDETAKELVWTLAPESAAAAPCSPGPGRCWTWTPGAKGVLFTIPLTGLSAQVPPVLIKPEYEEDKEDSPMEKTSSVPQATPTTWCWPSSTGAATSRSWRPPGPPGPKAAR